MFRKIAVVAMLIALVVAMLPTSGVLAGRGTNQELEKKWDQLVTNFNRQNLDHNKAHKWVDAWLMNEKPKATEKEAVMRHLTICNTALMDAHSIVARHEGFDAKGKVIKPNLAYQSIKVLANALQRHAASVKNLKADLR